MSYETKVVVNMLDVDLTEEVYDTLCDKFDVCNGSYHKWYPNRPNYMVNMDVHGAVQKELIRLEVPMETDVYYSILLYFSW